LKIASIIALALSSVSLSSSSGCVQRELVSLMFG